MTKSSLSTDVEKLPDNDPETPLAFEAPLPAETDPKDAALDELGKQLEAAKDLRREERFIWLVAVVILIDVLWFKDAENAALPVIVLLLELVILFILARRMGIDDIVQLLDRLLHAVGNSSGKG